MLFVCWSFLTALLHIIRIIVGKLHLGPSKNKLSKGHCWLWGWGSWGCPGLSLQHPRPSHREISIRRRTCHASGSGLCHGENQFECRCRGCLCRCIPVLRKLLLPKWVFRQLLAQLAFFLVSSLNMALRNPNLDLGFVSEGKKFQVEAPVASDQHWNWTVSWSDKTRRQF